MHGRMWRALFDSSTFYLLILATNYSSSLTGVEAGKVERLEEKLEDAESELKSVTHKKNVVGHKFNKVTHMFNEARHSVHKIKDKLNPAPDHPPGLWVYKTYTYPSKTCSEFCRNQGHTCDTSLMRSATLRDSYTLSDAMSLFESIGAHCDIIYNGYSQYMEACPDYYSDGLDICDVAAEVPDPIMSCDYLINW
eukprot:CAMPEP_0196570804 /NCGR_PEP_ID=MMETSP1081-20130531/987_1 /TAXON_ID=36882 /ORGANISM="Pyramimonas amylifera, Strain CCMP720" /LENGTH=193 /DNA_ID=CAMNT_0041887471 /DNA_START=137 /DNA_END=715 /DNA_ORIENTATION=-